MNIVIQNPYQPPLTQTVHEVSNPLWKVAARVAFVVYGSSYGGLVVYANVEEFLQLTWQKLLWQLTTLSVDVLTCYGIFAMALRAIRHPLIFRVWRVFVWILPIFVFVDTAWELSKPETISGEDSPVILIVSLLAFLVIFAPALACNILLVSRLRSLYEKQRNQSQQIE